MSRTYDEIKAKVFLTVSRPNGYFGDRCQVGIALIGSQIVEVAECGCYASIMQATNRAEATWLILNHPSYRNYRIIREHSND